MPIFSMRLTAEEDKALTAYAQAKHLTKTAAIKTVFFEKPEDDYDAQIAVSALWKFRKYPEKHSSKEVDEILGI